MHPFNPNALDNGASKEASNKKSIRQNYHKLQHPLMVKALLLVPQPADHQLLLQRKNRAIKDDLKTILILLICTTCFACLYLLI